jgi:hypothetical protein
MEQRSGRKAEHYPRNQKYVVDLQDRKNNGRDRVST